MVGMNQRYNLYICYCMSITYRHVSLLSIREVRVLESTGSQLCWLPTCFLVYEFLHHAFADSVFSGCGG